MRQPLRTVLLHGSRRLMQHAFPAVPIVITDPSYVKTRIDYDENILPDVAGDAAHKSPGSHVRLALRGDLFERLGEMRLRASQEGDEMLLALGSVHPLNTYEYLGSHHSDSGLTCILPLDAYKEDAEELDWLELVAATLEGKALPDLDAFPLLKFYASIPEDDSVLAVFARKEDPAASSYDSLVLRAWCKAFPHESD